MSGGSGAGGTGRHLAGHIRRDGVGARLREDGDLFQMTLGSEL